MDYLGKRYGVIYMVDKEKTDNLVLLWICTWRTPSPPRDSQALQVQTCRAFSFRGAAFAAHRASACLTAVPIFLTLISETPLSISLSGHAPDNFCLLPGGPGC